MTQTYYITTPIYYVNDRPHIGHSYTTIAADTLARYFRSVGRDVRFLTGTDEHGIKIFKAAAERDMTPGQLADEVVVHFQKLWEDLEITNDDFIRTSQPRHKLRVQEMVRRLVEADEIYLGSYQGWYDEGQEEFVTESTARDHEYKSPINARSLVRYSEPSYFFRLGKWVPKLIEHIEANEGFIRPAARRNEVLSKLRQGVDDLSVSRSVENLPWGIEMPNDPRHVVYVWIDALSNYYTALGAPDIGDGQEDLERYWPVDVHLIGKDILWFHSVYWPCVLLALDIPLPKCVFAHGWWTSEGKKMSKSLGNFISLEVIAELCEEYSRDVYRWYLLRAVTFGSDGNFSREGFKTAYNTELANGLGNLLSRTVKMIGKYFDGRVPPRGPTGEIEAGVLAAAAALHTGATADMELCAFEKYLDKLVALATATNVYIDRTEPFKLAKDPDRRERLGTILYTCAEAVRILLLYYGPFLPNKAAAGLQRLGLEPQAGTLDELGAWGQLAEGTEVQPGAPLFPRK